MSLIDAAYGIADSNKKKSQECEKPSDTYKQDVITRIVEHVKTNGKLVEEIEKYNSAITDDNQKLDINVLVVDELDKDLPYAPCYISKYTTDNDNASEINKSMMKHVERKLREKVREQQDEILLNLFKPNEMKPGHCLYSVKYSISQKIAVKDRDYLITLINESGENFDKLFEKEAVQKFRTTIMQDVRGCFNKPGGWRRSKSAKHYQKRPTARRRRSSKRNARKARATRRR
jgi:hypothetical protein